MDLLKSLYCLCNLCKNSDLFSWKLHYSFSNLLSIIFPGVILHSPFYHHKWSNPALTFQFAMTALCPQIVAIQIKYRIYFSTFFVTRITNCCPNTCMEEFAILDTVLFILFSVRTQLRGGLRKARVSKRLKNLMFLYWRKARDANSDPCNFCSSLSCLLHF
jgi:hypothetical protein